MRFATNGFDCAGQVNRPCELVRVLFRGREKALNGCRNIFGEEYIISNGLVVIRPIMAPCEQTKTLVRFPIAVSTQANQPNIGNGTMSTTVGTAGYADSQVRSMDVSKTFSYCLCYGPRVGYCPCTA